MPPQLKLVKAPNMKWHERVIWITLLVAVLALAFGYHEHRQAMLECEAARHAMAQEVMACLEQTERVPEAFCVNAGPIDPNAPKPPKKTVDAKLKIGTKPPAEP
jgi:hypothetical protein